LVNSIKRYQDAITNTHSQLDYAIGQNMYLLPSNMVLEVGSIVQYNNNIKIANYQMTFGINEDINQPRVPSAQPRPYNHPKARPSNNITFVMKSGTLTKHQPQKLISEQVPKTVEPKVHGVLQTKTMPEQNHDKDRLYFALGLGAVVGGVAYYFKQR
jgi:hypothetical protein